MYLNTLRKNECTGCTACMHVCSRNAIQLTQDSIEGFYYPQISTELCVNCGLCEKICPVENPDYKNYEEPRAIAAYITNQEERKKSSSGGLFYAISKWIINKGGIVYGAAFDENLQLSHIPAKTMTELQRLRGSKYVQSNLKDTFKSIKSNLQEGFYVYFVGTPCQVAGLRAYLRKDYDNLLTSDLICHGVPSQQLFNQHIEYLEQKHKSKVVSYAFRDNDNWGGCEIVDLANGKRLKLPTYQLSPYLHSFMCSYTCRESCYDCRFSCIPRQGDITLADFWGVKNFFPDIDTSSGVSLLLLNSKKGEMLWSEINDMCKWQQSTVIDAGKENHNMTKKTERPSFRDEAYKIVDQRGYKSVAENEFRTPDRNRIMLKMAISNSLLFKLIKRIVK